MTRLNNHHRQNHAPEYTGDLSFVGKMGQIYIEISGQSKVSAWENLGTRIKESLSKWSFQELQELNTLPGVQNAFQNKLELTNGYFTENDWDNLEKWYIKNRGTGESDSILKSKFTTYKNNYEKQLQDYLIREYSEVLAIVIQRAQEPTSGKIGENSQKLLNEMKSLFPQETTQLLKIKAIQDAHAKTTKRTLTFEDDTGLMKSIKERVKNTLNWGNKSIKNLKRQKRRVLGILLLSSAALVGGGYLLKQGKIGSIESVIREENDTLVLGSSGFLEMIKHKNSIPWEILSDSNLMESMRLGCDTSEQNWWERLLPKDYDVQRYHIDKNCTITGMRGVDIEKIRLIFQMTHTKKSEPTIALTISDFKNLIENKYTKEVITTLPKMDTKQSITLAQIQSILNAAKSIQKGNITDRRVIGMVIELIEKSLDTNSIIVEDTWSTVIGQYHDYIQDTEKNIEKFESFTITLIASGFIINGVDAIPNFEWPKNLRGEALRNNVLFKIGIDTIVANFVSKEVKNSSDEIRQAIHLLMESESSMDPGIKNKSIKNTASTSASGLFQILQSHMSKFGWGNKKITDLNPIEQIQLFNKFVDKNFEYQGEQIKTQMDKLGAFAGWMGTAHIHNQWAREPRRRVSGFDDFVIYLTKQELRIKQSSFPFSEAFKQRIESAKVTLQQVIDSTKNIPQSMEAPILPEEHKEMVLGHINTMYLESLRPTSGVFVKRSFHDRRTQIGGDGLGKEHFGNDLIPIDDNYVLQPLLSGEGVQKFGKVFSGYGNTLIEAKKLPNGEYLISLAAHLELQRGQYKIGSTGASRGVHLHVEFFKVGENGQGYRIGPPWSGTGQHLSWRELFVMNTLTPENAGFFFSDIFPEVQKHFNRIQRSK